MEATEDVLTIEEAARTLRISVSGAKRMALAGDLPGAFKLGRLWRIRAVPFREWIDGGGLAGVGARRPKAPVPKPASGKAVRSP